MGATDTLGLYISIPFCRSKCTYCNFASGVYPVGEQTRYVERLIEDLAGARAWAKKLGAELPQRVDTIYLGGGTPSLLAPQLLKPLFEAVRAEFSIDPDAEVTMECAPGQLADETLASLSAAGVNRVSLGVQSFVDREAQLSGRLHNRAKVEADLHRLRAAGIENLNIDLIAGLPAQTFASWEESLAVLVDSGVPHASIYMLEVDEDSRLGREMLSAGTRYSAGLVPSDDAIASMYERAIERLEETGLGQYEISNFCRRGRASRHNRRYWERKPYLGVGLDASSMLQAACDLGLGAEPARYGWVVRASTTDELKGYLAENRPLEAEWLSPERQLEEAWFLGLRMNEGVCIEALEQEFGRALVEPALETARRLAEDGLAVFDEETVRLTARGRLIANEVFQHFLADAPDQPGIQPMVAMR
jgi:oxygen-independent coproporphyrinogen III oxidase